MSNSEELWTSESLATTPNASESTNQRDRNGGEQLNPNEADQVDGSTTAPSVPELAIEIQELDPTASPSEIARACLLITNTLDQLQTDSSEYVLVELWQAAVMKLQLAADQHEAMITELKELAQSNPEDFTKQQIWILLRAIKVQSQVLQIYTGSPSLDV